MYAFVRSKSNEANTLRRSIPLRRSLEHDSVIFFAARRLQQKNQNNILHITECFKLLTTSCANSCIKKYALGYVKLLILDIYVFIDGYQEIDLPNKLLLFQRPTSNWIYICRNSFFIAHYLYFIRITDHNWNCQGHLILNIRCNGLYIFWCSSIVIFIRFTWLN